MRDRGLFKGDTIIFGGEGGGGLEKTPPVFHWSGGSCLCITVLTSSLIRWLKHTNFWNCNEMIVTHKLLDCIEVIVTHKLLDCNKMIKTHKLLTT